MNSEPLPRDLERLWRAQRAEHRPVTLDDIPRNANALQKKIRRRNMREIVSAGLVLLIFGFYASVLTGWMARTGSVLVMIGALWIVWHLRRRASEAPLPDRVGMPLLEFHRDELIRQRDAAKSVAGWYIAPVVPGIVLMFLGRYLDLQTPDGALAGNRLMVVLSSAVVALTFAIVWRLNISAAKQLQQRVDELDALRAGM